MSLSEGRGASALRLSAALLAALATIVIAASLFTGLNRHRTVDEPAWLERYTAYQQAPFDVPDQPNPFAGMGNRVLIGLPGLLLQHVTGLPPTSAFRLVQIVWFLLAAAAAAWWIAGAASEGKRLHALPLALLVFASVPIILAMSRTLNYDTVSSLACLLALLALARGMRTPDDTDPFPGFRVHAGWALAAGLLCGLAIATKAYGLIATAFILGVLMLAWLLNLAAGRWRTSLAALPVFAGATLAALFAFTTPAWVDPARLALYNRVAIQGNLESGPAGTVLAVALACGMLLAVTLAVVLRKSAALRNAAAMTPRTLLRLAAGTLLILLLFAYAVQDMTVYLPAGQVDEEVLSQTAHVTYTFGTPSPWSERLLNASNAVRLIVYTLPLHLLLVLAAAAVVLLARPVRLPFRVKATALVLAGFIAFFLLAAAYGRVIPAYRYYLPVYYCVTALGALILCAWIPRRPMAALGGTVAGAAMIAVLLNTLSPHYHGYVNILRDRDRENMAVFGEKHWIWGGWGEGLDVALAWIAEQGGGEGTHVAADYGTLTATPMRLSIRRQLLGYWPDADYFVFHKVNTYREIETARLFSTTPPDFAHGYAGADSVYVYRRDTITRYLFGDAVDPALPHAMVSPGRALMAWNLHLAAGPGGPVLSGLIEGDPAGARSIVAQFRLLVDGAESAPARTRVWHAEHILPSSAERARFCMPFAETWPMPLPHGAAASAEIRVQTFDADGVLLRAGATATPVPVEAGIQAAPGAGQVLFHDRVNHRAGQPSREPGWHPLGRFYLSEGEVLELEIDNTGTTKFVILDAVRLVGPAEVIVDESDPAVCVLRGPWERNAQREGYWDGTNVSDNRAHKGDCAATYTLTVPASGVYSLEQWRVPHPNRAEAIPTTLRRISGN